MRYQKIGGMHWLFISRLRIAFCVKRKRVVKKLTMACAGPDDLVFQPVPVPVRVRE